MNLSTNSDESSIWLFSTAKCITEGKELLEADAESPASASRSFYLTERIRYLPIILSFHEILSLQYFFRRAITINHDIYSMLCVIYLLPANIIYFL